MSCLNNEYPIIVVEPCTDDFARIPTGPDFADISFPNGSASGFRAEDLDTGVVSSLSATGTTPIERYNNFRQSLSSLNKYNRNGYLVYSRGSNGVTIDGQIVNKFGILVQKTFN
jgi:hypothetical protein